MTLRAPPADRSIDELVSFGVVNIDKPPGPASHQVSSWVRDLVDVEKAAHTGTLDPKVTGCLPILLGDATRLAGALLEQKEYVSVLELHGEPPANLSEVITEFTGEIYQKPPRKSAVKRTLRIREISDITVLETKGRQVLLRVSCESGTYIRKLCHDLGLVLGTGAHMGDLRRTKTTPFDDTTLITLHDLADTLAVFHETGDESALREIIHPGERALVHLPHITIAPSAAEQVAHGAPVYAPGIISADADLETETIVACYTPDGSAVCLGKIVGDPTAEAGMVVKSDHVLA